MTIDIDKMRADTDNTLFKDAGQTVTIKNFKNTIDSTYGNYNDNIIDSEAVETIVMMSMSEAKQIEQFGRFNPSRFKIYLRYNSIAKNNSIITDSNNDNYVIDELHDAKIGTNTQLKKGTAIKSN